MQDEAIDADTQQTLDFLNNMEDEETDTSSQQTAETGLKATTFGALHRQSEAKKNIMNLPTIEQVLDQVRFEMHELPQTFEEALAQCQ